MPVGSTWRKSKSRSSPNSVSIDDSRHLTTFNATPPLGHATATGNAPRSPGPSTEPTLVVYSQNSTGRNLLDDVLVHACLNECPARSLLRCACSFTMRV